MERGLALALMILISLGVVLVKISEKAGLLHETIQWHHTLAANVVWLMLVPLLYAALCEIARSAASSVALTVARSLGFVLLAGFALIFASIIYDF